LNTFKTVNMGAEFFQHLMDSYFEPECLKNLDIRTIIDKLKQMESDCHDMLKEAGNDNKQSKAKQVKYRFMPIETHQMMEHISKKTDEEFKQPNIHVISDDEGPIMQSVRSTNIENHRMYNKYDLQMDIKSDNEGSFTSY
jgi:hypothetical protein